MLKRASIEGWISRADINSDDFDIGLLESDYIR